MVKGTGKLTSATRAPIGIDGTRAEAKPAWPVWCVLALVVASDFKFRLRANDQAVSGNADPFVLLEIALYAAVACFLFVKFRPSVRTRRADLLTWLAYAYAIVLAGSALYSPISSSRSSARRRSSSCWRSRGRSRGTATQVRRTGSRTGTRS